MIKLPASVDDYAYLLSDDYCACVDSVAQEERVSLASCPYDKGEENSDSPERPPMLPTICSGLCVS